MVFVGKNKEILGSEVCLVQYNRYEMVFVSNNEVHLVFEVCLVG